MCCSQLIPVPENHLLNLQDFRKQVVNYELLKISHDGSIFNTEIGKFHGSWLCPLGLQVVQHLSAWHWFEAGKWGDWVWTLRRALSGHWSENSLQGTESRINDQGRLLHASRGTDDVWPRWISGWIYAISVAEPMGLAESTPITKAQSGAGLATSPLEHEEV